MGVAAASKVLRVLSPAWLTGPIFEKELRVGSRRRRNYVLRVVYLGLLTAFVALAWLAAVEDSSSGTAAYRASKMAEIGQIVIATIIWFQFCMLQLVAVILCSTAISDEVYRRTLGVLMTTPINSFQIVMGKLLSRLLQLLILLAISLPLLAVVRVFGGVPWDYVLAGLAITLTATIFAASVSILFSVFTRHAYAAILMTFLAGGVLYFLLPVLAGLVLHDAVDWDDFFTVLSHLNPPIALGATTMDMANPAFSPVTCHWPVHCLVMLGASAGVLALCVRLVRRAALRQIGGSAQPAGAAVPGSASETRQDRPLGAPAAVAENSPGNQPVPVLPVPIQAAPWSAARPAGAAPVRPVNGPPVLWRELRMPLLRRRRSRIVGALIVLIVLGLTYLACLAADEDLLADEESHIFYGIVFVLAGMVTTAIVSATTITTEKEAGSWPILLTTPLSRWGIVLGKWLGAIRRCLSVWMLLFIHLGLFLWAGCVHPIALLFMAIIVAYLNVFLAGSGVFFSAMFRRTTTAVVMNLGLGLALWAVLPLLLALGTEAADLDDSYVEFIGSANPVFQVGVILDETAGARNANRTASNLTFDWPGNWNEEAEATLGRLVVNLVCYGLVGLLLLTIARSRLRTRPL